MRRLTLVAFMVIVAVLTVGAQRVTASSDGATVTEYHVCEEIYPGAIECFDARYVEYDSTNPAGVRSYGFQARECFSTTVEGVVKDSSCQEYGAHGQTNEGVIQELNAHAHGFDTTEPDGVTCRWTSVFTYADGRIRVDMYRESC